MTLARLVTNRVPRTFALRSLLLAVAIFALALGFYCNQRPPYEVRQVRLAMTQDEMIDRLGLTRMEGGSGGNFWTYDYEWGSLTLRFPALGDRCANIQYCVVTEKRAYRSMPDGSYSVHELGSPWEIDFTMDPKPVPPPRSFSLRDAASKLKPRR